MAEGQEIWRWQSDPAWHYHCSMGCEAAMAREANNEFMRYHHVRACIYFAVSALESFLNGHMRRVLENRGMSEKDVYRGLRRTSLDIKRRDWPSQICGKDVRFSDEVDHVFEMYRELRNEITHPKRRDQSIYPELERADPDELADAISVAFVTIFEGKKEPFPYWLLGWNYVGMNGNAAYPCQSNNLNGFVWSLQGMGFDVQAGSSEWDKQYMVTLEHYWVIKAALAKYPADIEPYWPDLPMRPRLTRRWWDHEFIYANIEKAKEETERLRSS